MVTPTSPVAWYFSLSLVRQQSKVKIPKWIAGTRRHLDVGDDGGRGGADAEGGRSEGVESVAGGRHPRRRDRGVAAPALRHRPGPPRGRHHLYGDR